MGSPFLLFRSRPPIVLRAILLTGQEPPVDRPLVPHWKIVRIVDLSPPGPMAG
jgi:hypothetical protein